MKYQCPKCGSKLRMYKDYSLPFCFQVEVVMAVCDSDEESETPCFYLVRESEDVLKAALDSLQRMHSADNSMSTLEERALHYVECYILHWPGSGAGEVAEELRQRVVSND